MRRESTTVVALVGAVDELLLADLGHSPNVAVVRAPTVQVGKARTEQADERPRWVAGAIALREAAHRQSAYVLVADDPLADVAAAWQAMWDLAGGPEGPAQFETSAAEALAAWRGKQFELPDYYLLAATTLASGTGPDLYLGPLRAARPSRVAATIITGPDPAGAVLDALRSLTHGPWWPPLDELLDAARHSYAGGLSESQPPSS